MHQEVDQRAFVSPQADTNKADKNKSNENKHLP
jgi:hypothetical protein